MHVSTTTVLTRETCSYLDALRWALAGVVLVILSVVLVVHLLSILLGLVLGLLTVGKVHALGLSELVDFSTSEASKELLGELVINGLAYGA